jgi:protein TonB
MEEEAVRVLRKATKWEPAIQGGYAVKAYHRQPITFEVLNEE